VIKAEEFSDSVSAGDVVRIDPSDQARKFSKITVTVSKGPQMVTVPQIAQGESSEDASAALRAVGLVPQIEKSIDGGVFDKVFSVSPGPGNKVPAGSTVTLTIV
jgi:serine/threonine-protein kinase